MTAITSIEKQITYDLEAVRVVTTSTGATMQVPREEVRFYRRVWRADGAGFQIGSHRLPKRTADGKKFRIEIVAFPSS